MSYTISGTVSAASRILVLNNHSWTVESNTISSGNTYEVTIVGGDKTIIAREISTGYVVGYGGMSYYDDTPPEVYIIQPTTSGTYSTALSTITLSGTASDNVGVTQVSWVNSANTTSGIATGTTNWYTSSITLVSGSNTLRVIAQDANNNTSSGTLVVNRYNPDPVTLSSRFPSSAAQAAVSPYDDRTWSVITNILSTNSVDATVSYSYNLGYSYILKAQGFNLSSIPDGSTINGIKVYIIYRYSEIYNCATRRIDMISLLNTSGNIVGTKKGPTTVGSSNYVTSSYGGTSDLWGNALTASWVKNSNFGVGISMYAEATSGYITFNIDSIYLDITYTSG